MQQHDENPGATSSYKALRIIAHILIYYVIPAFYIYETVVHWDSTPVCLRREAVINCIYLIYYRFISPSEGWFQVDVVQILSVLWLVNHINNSTLETDSECFEIGDSLYRYATHSFFLILFWTHSAIAICFILLLTGLVIYGVLEVFYFQPRRRRRRGLSEEEYAKLERVVFTSADINQNTDLHTCSICIEDFKDGEVLIQLPVCNHRFHDPCVKDWFTFNAICPNDRRDVKQLLRDMSLPRAIRCISADGD